MSLKNNRQFIMRFLSYLLFTLLGSASFNSLAFPVAKYAGFGLGYTYTELNANDPTTDFGGTIEVPTYSTIKKQGLPWNAYIGMRFHPNYAFEFGFLNYSSIKFIKTFSKTENDINGESVSTVVRNAKVTTRGFYLSHVMFYNITQRLNAQFKVGMIFGSNNYTDNEVTTVQPSDDSSDVQVTPGFSTSSKAFAKAHLAMAMVYRGSKEWSYQLQLNQIQFDHDTERESFDQWLTSLSARYHF